MTKLYEVWQGNNNIYCKGALITGPDRVAFWLAEILILGSFVYFWVFICRPFMEQYSWSPVFIIGSLFILAIIICTHLMAAFTEPGIIPRTQEEIPEIIIKEEKQEDGTTTQIYFCKTCRYYYC
jgi:hypothetical protein